jgi:hypothetical protein
LGKSVISTRRRALLRRAAGGEPQVVRARADPVGVADGVEAIEYPALDLGHQLFELRGLAPSDGKVSWFPPMNDRVDGVS